MSALIFSSDRLFSISGPLPLRYKAEVSGENYVGLFAEITGGAGNTFFVAEDWTDYLQNAQGIEVTEIGVSTDTSTVITFSYNSGLNRTEIEIGIPFDSKWDTIEGTDFAPTFAPLIKDLETEWEDQGDVLLAAIKESHTNIEYYNNDVFFDRFIDLFLNSNDDEFKLVIYRRNAGDTDWDLEWVGNMVVDGLEWDNMDKPRPFSFRAIDGINMLKDVNYAEALTGSANLPLIEHLITALGYINTSQFFGSGPYIRESNEYESVDVPGLTDSDSVFEYAFFNDRVFIERNNDDTIQGVPVYSVIVAIMEILSCRIFLAQGVWWVQQIRNFNNLNIIVYREFTNSIGNPPIKAQYNHKKTLGQGDRSKDLVQMARGKFNNHPGLLNVKVTAEQPGLVQSIVDDTIGRLSNATKDFQRVYDLGNASGGIGVGAKIRIEFMVDELSNPTAPGTYFFQCQLQITTPGGDFIKGSLRIDPFWGNGAASNKFWIKHINSVAKGNTTRMVFETPELPFDDDITVTLDFFLSGTTASGAEYWRVYDLKTFVPSDDGDIADIEYNVGNPNSNFTKELDLGTLIINDESKVVGVNALQVDKEFTTANPRDLIKSTVWDAGFDTDLTLTGTRALEAMALQFKPVQILRSNIEGDYYPFYSLDYNNKIYVFAGFKFNYTTDEQDGEWFEVATARGGVSATVIKRLKPGTPVIHGSEKKYNDDHVDNAFILTTASTTPTPIGITTTVFINAPGHERLKSGDTVDIIHRVTNAIVETVVLSADVGGADTTMSVVELTTVNLITEGMYLSFKKGEVVDSAIIRGGTLVGAGGSNNELLFNNNGVVDGTEFLTVNESTKTFRFSSDLVGFLDVKGNELSSNQDINLTSANSFDINLISGSKIVGFNTTVGTAIADLDGATSAIASLRIREQVAVSSPNNGDVYNDEADNKLKFYNGIVTDILSVAGSDTHIQFNSGGVRTGSSNLTWNGSELAITGDFAVGTNDFFVDDSLGRVGIGTFSPQGKFHLIGASTNEMILEATAGNPDFSMAESGNVKTQIIYDISNNGLLFRIEDGNVGYGAVTGKNLFLEDGGRVGFNTTGPNAFMELVVSGTTDRFMISSSTGALGDKFIVDGTNKVGINQITPTARLSIDAGNANAATLRLHTQTTVSSPNAGDIWFVTDRFRFEGILDLTKRLLLSTVTTLANNATPPVDDGNIFKTGGTTAITDFDDGEVGQTIQILAEHTITITDGTPIQLMGGQDFNMVSQNTLTLTMFNDQIWHEMART